MRRTSLFCAGALLVSLAATAVTAGEGGHAGAMYRIGIGAQSLGIGGAVVSLAQEPSAILSNPAGAAYTSGGTFVASRTMLAADRSVNVLGFGRRLDARAGFSIAWVNAGVGNVQGFDANGDATGDLANGDNLVSATFGTNFGFVAAGVSAKWYRHELDDRNSTGWLFDLGVLARPVQGLRIGAAVRDLVGKEIWTSDRGSTGMFRVSDEYPATVAAGASYFVQRVRTTIAVDAEVHRRGGRIRPLRRRVGAGGSRTASRRISLAAADLECRARRYPDGGRNGRDRVRRGHRERGLRRHERSARARPLDRAPAFVLNRFRSLDVAHVGNPVPARAPFRRSEAGRGEVPRDRPCRIVRRHRSVSSPDRGPCMESAMRCAPARALALVLSVFAVTAHAVPIDGDAGSRGYKFLQVLPDARAARHRFGLCGGEHPGGSDRHEPRASRRRAWVPGDDRPRGMARRDPA